MDESMNEYTVKFDGKITVLPGKKKITLTSNGFGGFFTKTESFYSWGNN